MEVQIVQIDLINKLEIISDGYAKKIKSFQNNRIQIIEKKELQQRTYYISGVFYEGLSYEEIENEILKINKYHAADFADKLDGEFNIIIWDHIDDDISIISDKSGTKKVFYNYTDGIVTITSRLTDQAKLQSAPSFSEYGIYTSLVISYTQDPYTFLNKTWGTRLGEIIAISREGKKSNQFYYKPVNSNFEGYSNINKSVSELDSSLKKYFNSRISEDTVPVVMLSGGIDSVVMMSYLHDVSPKNLNSLTFAIGGSPSNELTEAKIAADFYQSKHHELIIDAGDILNNTISGFIDHDAFQLGNAYSPAIQQWIKKDPSVVYDIYRGEDTRLHTPFFDFPFLMGLMASRKKNKIFRKLWSFRKIFNYWPIRFGKNYLKYAVNKSAPADNMQAFLLQSCLRLNLPADTNKSILFDQLLHETKKLLTVDTMDEIHRGVIEHAFNIQYSEDNKNAKMASVSDNSFFLMPFLHPNVVTVSNNIPYKQSASIAFVSPKKTRSYFFMSDKIILRKLMKGKAPEELLYRRKTTAPNNNYFYDQCWSPLFKPLLLNYSGELLETVKEQENKDLLNHYIKKLLRSDGEVMNDWSTAWHGSTIIGMLILMLMMQKKVTDVASLKKLLLIED
jgi:Asparagine synthase